MDALAWASDQDSPKRLSGNEVLERIVHVAKPVDKPLGNRGYPYRGDNERNNGEHYPARGLPGDEQDNSKQRDKPQRKVKTVCAQENTNTKTAHNTVSTTTNGAARILPMVRI